MLHSQEGWPSFKHNEHTSCCDAIVFFSPAAGMHEHLALWQYQSLIVTSTLYAHQHPARLCFVLMPGRLQGTLVLPQPASKEAMDSLNQWMYGEVAPEDLPQVDEEAAKMDPGAPTELNEQGNAIIQREFTGSYTNPSAWNAAPGAGGMLGDTGRLLGEEMGVLMGWVYAVKLVVRASAHLALNSTAIDEQPSPNLVCLPARGYGCAYWQFLVLLTGVSENDVSQRTPDHSPGLKSPPKGPQLYPGTIFHSQGFLVYDIYVRYKQSAYD
eukprot:1140855-Pelagomonas_calceolata.AAC.4